MVYRIKEIAKIDGIIKTSISDPVSNADIRRVLRNMFRKEWHYSTDGESGFCVIEQFGILGQMLNYQQVERIAYLM